MKSYVLDTHGLFWHLTKNKRLGAKALAAIKQAEAGLATLFIPAVVLAELFYLNRKQGDIINFSEKFSVLQATSHFQLMPLEPEDILDLGLPRFAAITEMHDRLIAAAAYHLGAELFRRDENITESKAIPVIW